MGDRPRARCRSRSARHEAPRCAGGHRIATARDRGEGVRQVEPRVWALETRQVEEARRNRNFFVYVVENVRHGDPALFSLKVLDPPRLGRLLERAKERRYYEVPWPVADYDSYSADLAATSATSPSARAATVMGVDGYSGGWIAVELCGDGTTTARSTQSFADLLDTDAAVIAVDIPIGLEGRAQRAVDATARRAVGGRSSSVFTTPDREVLLAPTHAAASALARTLTGKGISQQSFALRHRILEIEPIADSDERVIEVHPEVSFAELAGRPLEYSKHTGEGLAERRALLAQEGISIPTQPVGVPEADVLDATVAAWTARRFAQNQARSFPEDHDKRIGAIWA